MAHKEEEQPNTFAKKDRFQFKQLSQMEKKPKRRPFAGLAKYFKSTKGLISLVIIFQIIIILLILSTPNFLQNLWTQVQDTIVLKLTERLTPIDESQNPLVAIIKDADQLRSSNPAQALVYKDAQNGDYIIGVGDKIIIYRRSENKVIYNGDNPATLLQKAQDDLKNSVVAKAKQAGIIDANTTEVPQLSIITNPDEFAKNAPDFYKGLQANDIVAYFQDEETVVLYRPSSNAIINSGKYIIGGNPTSNVSPNTNVKP